MNDVTIDRHLGIGGSECAAVLGVSKWATPLEVYANKTNPEQALKPASVVMDMGTILEPYIIKAYEQRTGKTCEKPQERLVNPKYPYLFANLDSWINGTNLILEAKTTGNFAEGWDEEETDQIPLEYLCQVAHYCIVGDAYKTVEGADILALNRFSGEFRLYKYKRDAELEELIIKKTEEFWHKYVLTKTPPPPTSRDDIAKIYNIARPESFIEANEEIENKYQRLTRLKEGIKELELQKELVENEVKMYMNDHESLLDKNGNILVTWKNQSTNRLDTKTLKIERPELYKQYCKSSITRVFRGK